MRKTDISDYLSNDYTQASLYMTYRSLPSVVDGLKNSGRKVVYTCRKDGMRNDLMKVTSFGGAVTTRALYLHGDSSMAGVISSMTQSFTGSNNLPVLRGSGNFGTRFSPDPSAPRYIYSGPSGYFDLLFRKEDDPNLIAQEFEFDRIEPRFYCPTIPLLLANGSEGIGVGFSSRILARAPRNLMKLLRARLTGKKVMSSWFTPSWNGFRGSVSRLDDCRWCISGEATLTRGRIRITEIPVTFSHQGYLAVLDKLRDQGLVEKYYDYCDPSTDTFSFEVTPSPTELAKPWEDIMQDLKLSIVVTEIPTCINENNAVEEFGSVEELFRRYYDVKLEYQKLKLESEVRRLTQEYDELLEVSRFIKDVIRGTISLRKKRSEVEDTMRARKYTCVDRLLALPLYSLTEEKAAEAVSRAEDRKRDLDDMKALTPEALWLRELDELEKAL